MMNVLERLAQRVADLKPDHLGQINMVYGPYERERDAIATDLRRLAQEPDERAPLLKEPPPYFIDSQGRMHRVGEPEPARWAAPPESSVGDAERVIRCIAKRHGLSVTIGGEARAATDEVDAVGAALFRDWDVNDRSPGGATEFYRGMVREFIGRIRNPERTKLDDERKKAASESNYQCALAWRRVLDAVASQAPELFNSTSGTNLDRVLTTIRALAQRVTPAQGITANWVIGYLPADCGPEIRDQVVSAFAEWSALKDAGDRLRKKRDGGQADADADKAEVAG